MFGIDDAIIGGLVGGGLKMLANEQSNDYAMQNAAMQNAQQEKMQKGSELFNAQMMRETQGFNASQADIARQFSAYSQGEAQQFNASQAELNRNFQERMSSTAYQRSRADMLAAGLNPILAAGAGGASTPGGSQGSIGAVSGPSASSSAASIGTPQAARISDRAALIEGVVSSAAEAARLKPTIDLMNQQVSIAREDTEKRKADTRFVQQQEAESRARTDKEMSAKVNIEHDTKLKQDELNRIKLFGFDINPMKNERVIGNYLGSKGGANNFLFGGDPRLLEMGNSAISLMRGILGPGTGGR